jgi:hypothetical protein
MKEERKDKRREEYAAVGEIIPDPRPGSVVVTDEEGKEVNSGMYYERVYTYEKRYAPFGFITARDEKTGMFKISFCLYRDDEKKALIAELDPETLTALRECIDRFIAPVPTVQPVQLKTKEEVYGYV